MFHRPVDLFNKVIFVLSLFLVVSITGCGGSGGDSAPAGPTSKTVTGGGVKGPLALALVSVYSFDASQPGFFNSATPVATGTTDATTAITGLALPFPIAPPYIMELTSTPGTTTDITTGAYPVITTMRTVITQALLDSGEQIYATPLTTMAVDIAVANADSNILPFTGDNNGTTTEAEFLAALPTAASQVVSTLGFGMDGSIDIFDTPPLVDSTTDSTEELTAVAAYRAAVEAVTAIAYQIDQQTAGGTTDSVLAELAADLADGGGINGSAGTEINTNTLQVLEQDPATLPIPTTDPANPTNLTVANVQAILVAETTKTTSTTDTTDLDAGGSITTEPAPAETNPNLDGDSALNADDAFPNDPTETLDTDGDNIGNNADTDDDNDGWADGANVDDYPLDATLYIDPALNRDGDTILNGVDNCPMITNEDQADTDTDGVGDACSSDSDGDGVDDVDDNCPLNANPGQENVDADTDGDVCDTNIDGDSELNDTDAFPYDPTETIDTDGDGTGDNTDADIDGDGVVNGADTGVAPVGAPSEGVACSLLRDCDGDTVFDGSDFDPIDGTVTFNFAPVANDDIATAAEDAALFSIDVTTNDTDDDGNPADVVTLTAIGTNNTAIGSAAINGNNIDYTPVAEASGVDTFTYTVTDGTVTSTGSVTVTITAENDAPTFTSTQVITIDEDAAYSYTAAASDVDTTDTLTLSAPVLPAWLSFDAGTGALTGTPDNSNVGVHAVVIRVNDGTVDVDQSFNITVANTPDAPAFTTTAVTSVNEDSTYTYTAAAADVDVGASLTLSAPTLPTWMTFTPGTGELTGAPTNAQVGDHSVTLRVTDSITAPVDQSFTVTVVNVNDAPVFDTAAVLTVDEDSVYTYDADVSDIDPGPDTLTLSTLGLPVWLGFDPATGILTGTPLNADVGNHIITLRVNDGTVNVDQTFTIAVANTNDAPVLADDLNVPVAVSTATPINVLANDSDEDVGDPLTITAVTQGATGTVDFTATGVTYTDTSGTSGTDSFTYTVTDDGNVSRTANVSVTVTVDIPPAFTSTEITTVNEDVEYNYSIAASDADVGDIATLTAPVLPGWLTFTPAAPGASTTATLVGTPSNAEVGVHDVTLTVTANSVSVDQIFTITVANVNDAPTIDSTLPSTVLTEGDAFNYTFSASDIDVGDNLTYSISALPAWLSFTPGTGVLTGTTAVVGSYPITITATDDGTNPSALSTDQVFTITVNPPGTPIAMTTLFSGAENGVAGIDNEGPDEYFYWTDNWNSVTGLFTFADKEYNHATGVFDNILGGQDLFLSGTSWVNEGNVYGTDDGSGGLNLSIRSASNDAVVVASVNMSARYVDLQGELISNYLNPVWQGAMINPSATFNAGAKALTQYRFEELSDSYNLWVDDWCIGNGTQYSDLNNNCNGVYVGTTITGFANFLTEVIQPSEWVDNDDGSTPPAMSWVASDDTSDTNLEVQFVTGGIANYYVIDWNGTNAERATLVDTGSWVQDTSSGVEMIHYQVPAIAAGLFAADLDDLNFFLTEQNDFVRRGEKNLVGDVGFDSGAFNGNAMTDILNNFSAPAVVDCTTIGGPLSYTTFEAVIADCGPVPISAVDLEGQTFTTVGAPSEEFTYNTGGTGSFTDDGGVTTRPFFWSIDGNGYLVLTDSLTSPTLIDISVAYGIDPGTGGVVFKAYTEETSLGGDLVLDGTADGEIWEDISVPVAPLTCGHESGWDDFADGGLGAPINPNSFADYEDVVTDCGALSINVADVAGRAFNDSGDITTFDATAVATEASPGSGRIDEGDIIEFEWYVETVNAIDYLVVYSNATISPNIATLTGDPDFWFRETTALRDIIGTPGASGSTYSFVKYSEQKNYSDTDRATGADGEIWYSEGILQ